MAFCTSCGATVTGAFFKARAVANPPSRRRLSRLDFAATSHPSPCKSNYLAWQLADRALEVSLRKRQSQGRFEI